MPRNARCEACRVGPGHKRGGTGQSRERLEREELAATELDVAPRVGDNHSIHHGRTPVKEAQAELSSVQVPVRAVRRLVEANASVPWLD